jgi:RNA polymerase sigma factor (sigma-70 family)
MERQSVTDGTLSGRSGPTGDATAERLYAEYSERLLAFCLKQLRSRSEAEDAVQVTFLCALRALRRGVVPESESAWLHAIARNVCRWQQRTASRRPVTSAVEVESVAEPAAEDDTGLLGELREALASLPERQRHALLLREWRGLSALEIAEHLHLSPPATHALLTRARRSLAHALTAPQRAALGVASLVYELRGWLKAALGGASAKVAVATIAVGVGVGGAVVVDQSVAGDKRARQPVDSAQSSPAATVGARVGATGRTTAVGSSAGLSGAASAARGAADPRGTTAAAGSRPRSGSGQTMRGRALPGSPPEPGSTPGPTTSPREPDPRVTDPLAGVALDPLEPPELPPVELPPVELPPVDLPPVDLPPVDLPPVDVPPVDVPTEVLPPVDLPPVDLPPADVPPVDPPPLPPLLP